MNLFNKKKWKNINHKKDQYKLFINLLSAPKKFEIRLNGKYYQIFLLAVQEDSLIFSYIDPLYLNSEIKENVSYKFIFEALLETEANEFEFYSNLKSIDSVDSNFHFSYPDQIKQYSENFSITPLDTDNVKISFQIKNLPYYKKISKINSQIMYFEAELHHLAGEYNNKIIYDIDLYFPFNKIKVAAIFKYINKNTFAFQDYIKSDSALNAFTTYAVDYYIRLKKIEEYQEKTKEEKKKTNPSQENSLKIFVCDSKQSVTDYIYQFLKNRITNEIYLFNNFDSLVEALSSEKPFILIIDAHISNDSIEDLKTKLTRVIDYDETKVILLINQLMNLLNSDDNDTIRLMKPVDGQKLLDIILNCF